MINAFFLVIAVVVVKSHKAANSLLLTRMMVYYLFLIACGHLLSACVAAEAPTWLSQQISVSEHFELIVSAKTNNIFMTPKLDWGVSFWIRVFGDYEVQLIWYTFFNDPFLLKSSHCLLICLIYNTQLYV